MYTDADGSYKSAGTYDTPERAQEVAEQTERHLRLELAETSPADRAALHGVMVSAGRSAAFPR